jgi:hypothetical protein
MSEVLGDADPHDGPFHEDYDDRRDGNDSNDSHDDPYLDDFSDPHPVAALWSTVFSPAALAIAALIVAAASMIGFLSSYLVTNALTASHSQSDQLFGLRVNAWVQIGLGVVAVALALLAHRAARNDSAATPGSTRAMAGAALLVALLSIAQSVAALIIAAGAHVPSFNGSGPGSG